MTQYRIICPDGVEIKVSRVRYGQFKWQWFDREGLESLSTHLDGPKGYAKEIGGKFVAIRPAQPARPGYPTALANLLNGR